MLIMKEHSVCLWFIAGFVAVFMVIAIPGCLFLPDFNDMNDEQLDQFQQRMTKASATASGGTLAALSSGNLIAALVGAGTAVGTGIAAGMAKKEITRRRNARIAAGDRSADRRNPPSDDIPPPPQIVG
jgi:hypothetical protein